MSAMASKTCFLPVGLAAVLVAVACGCAGTQPAQPAEPMVFPLGTPGIRAVQVVFVRATEGYVIVRGEYLPNAGEQAKVFRDETPVGMVRFSGLRQGDCAAADILEGVLHPGDRVVR